MDFRKQKLCFTEVLEAGYVKATSLKMNPPKYMHIYLYVFFAAVVHLAEHKLAASSLCCAKTDSPNC